MSPAVASTTVLRGFFTSQKWLRGKTLGEMERLIGYRTGRLSSHGASVYAFTRVPELWEFDVKGYTNVSGGLNISPEWALAEQKAAAYYANTGMKDSVTRLKASARATMTVTGIDRLVKVRPLLDDPFDSYPAGSGIPQWRVSERAAREETLYGELLFVLGQGQAYPL